MSALWIDRASQGCIGHRQIVGEPSEKWRGLGARTARLCVNDGESAEPAPCLTLLSDASRHHTSRKQRQVAMEKMNVIHSQETHLVCRSRSVQDI